MSELENPSLDQRPDGPPVGLRRLSVVRFLIALVVMLVLFPFTDELPNGELIESVLLTLVLLSAVAAVGGWRRTLVAGTVLVTPTVAGKWISTRARSRSTSRT
jgi:hypothetical protein